MAGQIIFSYVISLNGDVVSIFILIFQVRGCIHKSFARARYAKAEFCGHVLENLMFTVNPLSSFRRWCAWRCRREYWTVGRQRRTGACHYPCFPSLHQTVPQCPEVPSDDRHPVIRIQLLM